MFDIACGYGEGVQIWDIRQSSRPLLTNTEYTSPVTALSYCSDNKNVLLLGGGRFDNRDILAWDSRTGSTIAKYAGMSQVSNLFWYDSNHCISTCNEPANQIAISEVNRRTGKIEILNSTTYHNSRIPYAAQNPNDKSNFVTVSNHERLCFWHLKNPEAKKRRQADKEKENKSSFLMTLR